MNLGVLLKNKIVVGLLLVYLMVLAEAGVTYEKLNTVVKDIEQLNHSHEVLRNVQNVFVDMLDAETCYRVYVITGNPTLLQPYMYAENAASAHVKQLLISTKFDSSKYSNALVFQRLVQKKLQGAQEIIALRIRYGYDSTMLSGSLQNNKRTMDSIRIIRGKMEEAEWAF